MASTIKVTNIDTPDNTGNIIVDRPLSGSGASLTNLPAANLTGTIVGARLPDPLPAISGASLTNLPAGGAALSERNFIIDGDFTQWPEGTTVTNPATDKYGPALWKVRKENSSAGVDYIRSTDVPTYAQSGHSSKYSMKIDCTTTTANPSHSTHGANAIRFFTTGSDNRYILGKEMTLSFWIKATKTGTSCVYFQNGSYNRTYVVEFTINTTLTWEKKTVTFTMDTAAGGTWGLAEADRGLQVAFALNKGGSVYAGAAGNWAASASSLSSTTNQINHLDSTSNVVYISQVMLVLGDTAPTAFLGESISTILNQIAYYVKPLFSGEVTHNVNTTMSDMAISHNPPMRVAPTYTHKDTTGTAWEGNAAGAQVQSSGTGILNPNSTPNGNTRYGTNVFTAGWSGLTGGKAMQINNGTTLFGILDARH